MRSRLAVTGMLLAIPLLGMLFALNIPNASATHHTSQCKWDFPWPRTVRYYIHTNYYDPSMSPTQFSLSQAQRISYGPSTWSEGGFNLLFERGDRTQSQNGYGHLSYVMRGNLVYSDIIAQTYLRTSNGTLIDSFDDIQQGMCHRDQGRPIVAGFTIFNSLVQFSEDCAAYSCSNPDRWDLHAVAAHEFGHWFAMDESGYHLGWSPIFGHQCTGHGCDDTMMQNIFAGDTHQRTLTSDDKDSARVMYGCRISGC